MRLIARRFAGAHLGIGECDLQRIQPTHHIGQLGRRTAAREPHQLRPWHVHIHQHPRQLRRVHRHRLGRNVRVQMMRGDKRVNHIEVMRQNTVHAGNATRLHPQTRLWVARAFERRKPVGRVLGREFIQTKRALVPFGKAPPAVW